MKFIKLHYLIFFLILFSCEKDEEIPVQAPVIITADSLMLKVEDVYSSAISYRDTGIVSTNFITDEIRLVEKPFKTAFLRSGLYRYEFHEIGKENSRYLIHRGETGIVSKWWDITGEIEIKESLSLAIAGATGVSSSSAFHIPSFLLPDELGFTNVLRRLENKEIIGSESIEGNDCYKLTGSHEYDGDIYTIWIQKNNFLLRRISDGHQFDTFRTETTIDILGEINIEMDDSEFEFDPPVTPVNKLFTTRSIAPDQSTMNILTKLEMEYQDEKQLKFE